MQRLVTPGWPNSIVGNEPFGSCRAASQRSARLIDASTRRHWAGASTLAGASLAAFGDSLGDLDAVEDCAATVPAVASSRMKLPANSDRSKRLIAMHFMSG